MTENPVLPTGSGQRRIAEAFLHPKHSSPPRWRCAAVTSPPIRSQQVRSYDRTGALAEMIIKAPEAYPERP
jgi:hypothetical protein